MIELTPTRNARFFAILLVLLAACGGSASKTPSGSGSTTPATVTLTAHDEAGPGPGGALQEIMANIAYKLPNINVKAGRFVVHLVNREVPPKGASCLGNDVSVCYSHEMRITDQKDKILAVSATIKPGADDVFVIDDLPVGTYPFYCGLKDHFARGMKGTITVS